MSSTSEGTRPPPHQKHIFSTFFAIIGRPTSVQKVHPDGTPGPHEPHNTCKSIRITQESEKNDKCIRAHVDRRRHQPTAPVAYCILTWQKSMVTRTPSIHYIVLGRQVNQSIQTSVSTDAKNIKGILHPTLPCHAPWPPPLLGL
jgi:hypothetical protein